MRLGEHTSGDVRQPSKVGLGCICLRDVSKRLDDLVILENAENSHESASYARFAHAEREMHAHLGRSGDHHVSSPIFLYMDYATTLTIEYVSSQVR